MEYEQLIPWVKPVETAEDGSWKEASDKAFRVIPGDYVTTEDGTGIVHIAPTFGADDANVARAAGIPSLFMINKKGETRPMVDLTGKFYLMDELDQYCKDHPVDIAALTLPKEKADETAQHLVQLGVHAIWNFAHVDLDLSDNQVVVENVHLSDSLMQLSYNIVKNS